MSSKAANRYAKALFSLASDRKALEAVKADLSAISHLLDTTPALHAVFVSPLADPKKVSSALKAVFKGKVHELSLLFLDFLISKSRLNIFAQIASEFARQCMTAEGTLKAVVASAVPLTDEQARKITANLEKRFAAKIRLVREIEPDLIGGFRVKVGDTVLDSSISTRLEKFRLALINA